MKEIRCRNTAPYHSGSLKSKAGRNWVACETEDGIEAQYDYYDEYFQDIWHDECRDCGRELVYGYCHCRFYVSYGLGNDPHSLLRLLRAYYQEDPDHCHLVAELDRRAKEALQKYTANKDRNQNCSNAAYHEVFASLSEPQKKITATKANQQSSVGLVSRWGYAPYYVVHGIAEDSLSSQSKLRKNMKILPIGGEAVRRFQEGRGGIRAILKDSQTIVIKAVPEEPVLLGIEEMNYLIDEIFEAEPKTERSIPTGLAPWQTPLESPAPAGLEAHLRQFCAKQEEKMATEASAASSHSDPRPEIWRLVCDHLRNEAVGGCRGEGAVVVLGKCSFPRHQPNKLMWGKDWGVVVLKADAG